MLDFPIKVRVSLKEKKGLFYTYLLNDLDTEKFILGKIKKGDFLMVDDYNSNHMKWMEIVGFHKCNGSFNGKKLNTLVYGHVVHFD